MNDSPLKLLYVFMAYGALNGAPHVGHIERSILRGLGARNKNITVFNHLAGAAQLYEKYKEKYRELYASDPAKYQYLVGYEASQALLPLLAASKPDCLLVVDGHLLAPDVLRRAGALGVKRVLWFLEDPYQSALSLSLAKNYDLTLTTDSSMLNHYAAAGIKNIHHLPLGFDPEIFYPQTPDPAFLSDICFVGEAFKSRVELFDSLGLFLSGFNTRIIGRDKWAARLAPENPIRKHLRLGFIPPDQTAKYFNGAKINLNIHRGSFDPEAGNNPLKISARSPNDRTFDLAGGRSFQIVDNTRTDINEYFEIGKEVVAYENESDLKDKILYYLDHEAERLAIALAGQQRALRDHTYTRRAEQIFDIIGRSL